MKQQFKNKWAMTQAWWMGLNQREKQAVLLGGFMVGFFLIYEMIWSPLMNSVHTLREKLVADQKTLVWMQTADQTMQSMAETHSQLKITTPVMLLSELQKQINSSGLGQSLIQLRQVSNDTVEIQFQKIEFDRVMTFLINISNNTNVVISQLTATPENAPGIVSINITFKIV